MVPGTIIGVFYSCFQMKPKHQTLKRTLFTCLPFYYERIHFPKYRNFVATVAAKIEGFPRSWFTNPV